MKSGFKDQIGLILEEGKPGREEEEEEKKKKKRRRRSSQRYGN